LSGEIHWRQKNYPLTVKEKLSVLSFRFSVLGLKTDELKTDYSQPTVSEYFTGGKIPLRLHLIEAGGLSKWKNILLVEK
jgi:hypothetical protein